MMYEEEIRSCSEIYDLPEWLIYAIIKTESNFNQYACRYEKNYKWLFKPVEVKPRDCSANTERAFQMTSWGLMQVMGAVYREYGYKGWLSLIPENSTIQIIYGCTHLKKLIDRFESIEKGIVAYNAGSPRKKDNGDYVNQYYLDKVMRYKDEYLSSS